MLRMITETEERVNTLEVYVEGLDELEKLVSMLEDAGHRDLAKKYIDEFESKIDDINETEDFKSVFHSMFDKRFSAFKGRKQ